MERREVRLVSAAARVVQRRCGMPTADAVREKALSLAESETTTQEAVQLLLEYCRDRRVAVVLARQQLLKDLEAGPWDPVVSRAAALLDRVLARLPLE
jgi:DNA repair protein RadC